VSTVEKPSFSIELPEEFQVTETDEGLHCVCQQPPGVLHLTPQDVEDPEDLPNLSRMLSGFLTRSGHPVATDELLQMTSVPNAHGFSWQYTEEGCYNRLWLFGNQYSWLLLHFVCPQEHYAQFHEKLNGAMKTLRLRADGPDPRSH
jgi:hypothetical protein